MVFALMLTSKGIAGVPRAGAGRSAGNILALSSTDRAIFVILGVDALIDMARRR